MTALGDDATVPKILMPSGGIRVGKGLSTTVRSVIIEPHPGVKAPDLRLLYYTAVSALLLYGRNCMGVVRARPL